jgi:hypothetical protein
MTSPFPATSPAGDVASLGNQKLEYMPSERLWPGGNDNPCKGKWDLCTSLVEYAHSSARFYIEGLHASYPVTNFMEMDDLVFVKLDKQ